MADNGNAVQAQANIEFETVASSFQRCVKGATGVFDRALAAAETTMSKQEGAAHGRKCSSGTRRYNYEDVGCGPLAQKGVEP
jgi:hypothetical protein